MGRRAAQDVQSRVPGEALGVGPVLDNSRRGFKAAAAQATFPFGRVSEKSGSSRCYDPGPQEIGMLTVHHLGVSQSERIVWLCEELDLKYELKRTERRSDNRLAPDEYKALHPMGVAPVITDGAADAGRERRDLRLSQREIWPGPAVARACRSGLSRTPFLVPLGQRDIRGRRFCQRRIGACRKECRGRPPGQGPPRTLSGHDREAPRRSPILRRPQPQPRRHHDGVVAHDGADVSRRPSRRPAEHAEAISSASGSARRIGGRWRRRSRAWRRC